MPAKKTPKPKPQLKNLDELFALDGEEAQGKLKIQEIHVNSLIPFEGHPFNLYEGERLDDMVASITANGVLVPVIVRKNAVDGEGNYEILAGHNRINAAKIAGLETVPAINMGEISDDEAKVYVIETNLMQRSFGDMTHSEKAAVVASHHSKMFSQGKRNDILERLKALENPDYRYTEEETETGQRTDEKIGAMYSLSRNTIARYLRIDRLVRELKPLVDNGTIPFLAGVEVSFLFLNEQKFLAECLESGHKINASKAAVLRSQSKAKTLDDDTIKAIIAGETADADTKPRKVKVSGEVYSRFFKPDQSPKEVESIVEEALTLFFANKGAIVE